MNDSEIETPILLTGTSNPVLAHKVASRLGIRVQRARVGTFANGEVDIKIIGNVRGRNAYVLQSTCSTAECNVNRSLMELLLMIHTLRLSSARRITAVIPHYAYARQDRKTRPRVPISASAVADMIITMGADAVIAVDLHSVHIQGFFQHCPVNDLHMTDQFAAYVRKSGIDLSQVVVVAPDAGAVTRARTLADRLGAIDICAILKRRTEASKIDTMQLVGVVEGRTCIIIDDLIDTAGTLCKAVEVLMEHAATGVYAYATHGVLTDPACQRLDNCAGLHEVVVSDSIDQTTHLTACPKLRVISLAEILADAIGSSHATQPAATPRI